MKRYTPLLAFALLITILSILTACNPLSDRARQMVGDYYNIELSETDPIYELRDDGTCRIRAIEPGVLTYCVDGKWNVERDTLFIHTDGIVAQAEGDTTLIGKIAETISRPVVDFTGVALTLRSPGGDIVYVRRGHVDQND